MNPTDEELLRHTRQGDTEAFGLIVERYQRRVFAVAYGLVHDVEQARDLVQEGFIRAYQAIDRFRGTSGFYTWIYRIVVNLCIDYIRKRAVERDAFSEDPDPIGQPPSTPEAIASRRELQMVVRRAIQKLPEDQRAVIVLREMEGLSYKEIAQVVDSSVGTVMSRLFYARKRLRDILKPYLQGGGHE